MKRRVIVIGGGGGGMCAALRASALGLDAVILEADAQLGGATALSSGVYLAAGTEVQRRNGIMDDSPDALFDFIMTLNQETLKPDIIRIMCDLAEAGLNFLKEQGVDFPDSQLLGGGVRRIARGHWCVGKGRGLADALCARVRESDIAVHLDTRVDRLIRDSQGKVVGAGCGDQEYLGDAVILASGGFGNNPEMLHRLFPSMAQHGEWILASAGPCRFILGDGIRLAEKVGANIVGFDSGLPVGKPRFSKTVESPVPPWLMFVNREGRRFMSETAAYSVSGYRINQQTGAHCYAIFDSKTLDEVSADLDYLGALRRVNVATWHRDVIHREVEAGHVHSAATLAELAEELGLPAVALAASVERYNVDCDAGEDREFFKSGERRPVRVPPFFAVEVRAATIGVTGAGLEIDNQTHVLDVAGIPVAGLYGAGEVLGCIIGERYAAGGVGITNAVVFGILAGESVAADLGVGVGVEA